MRAFTRTFEGSLQNRLIFLCSLTALISALLVGGIAQQRAIDQAEARATEQLRANARLAALQIEATFKQMRQDAYAASRTAPIEEMIGARRSFGVSHSDGSSLRQWRSRLEAVFEAFMRERPHYTTFRYLTVADGGMEIVRVNRTAIGFEVVAPENLQRRGDPDFFRSALSLEPDQIYYSDISDDIEHRHSEGDGVPTIRAVVPVFDDQRRRFGMVVVNADVGLVLRNTLTELSPARDAYLMLRNGSYAAWASGEKQSGHVHLDVDSRLAPEVVTEVSRMNFEEEFAAAADGVASVASLSLNGTDRDPDSGIVLMLYRASDALFADANQFRNKLIALSLLFTLITLVCAAAWTRELVRPLSDITERLRSTPLDCTDISLPVQRVDEIGALARAIKQRNDARVLLEHASEGIITINAKGWIEGYNSACARVFGYSAEEVIGRNVSMLMPRTHRGKHDGYIRDFLATGQSEVVGERREMRGQRRCGEIFPIELTIVDLEINGEMLITGTVRDISERKAAEAEREELIARLASSNKELESFAYVASHDLKVPLRTIDNASRWIEEDLGDDIDAEIRENLDLMRGRVTRMDRLLDDLLAYARISAATDHRTGEIVSGDQLMEGVLELSQLPKEFRVEISPRLREVKVDRMPLQQILVNLITNAVKHHDKGGGVISVGLKDMGDMFSFSVRDDGPGIRAEYLDEIFEMFRTLKPRDEVEGSGMGLAMVRKYIELGGGEISVRSQEGEGSEFIFTWRKPAEHGGGENDAEGEPAHYSAVG